MATNQDIINNLTRVIREFKSEEYILQGGTVTEDEMKAEEKELFLQHQQEFNNEEMDLNDKENDEKAYADFKEAYHEEISQIKEKLIKQDLKEYNRCLKRLQTYKGMIFYASDGKNQITNSSDISKKYFKTFPSYMVFDADEKDVYPEEIKDSKYYDWTLSYTVNELEQQDLDIYVAFSDEFINSKVNGWAAAKASSGSIPVNYEKIDIVSLITQGLGELNDKIKASQLQFKINHPKDKMYISADGRLLWRAIENLLSNIFKYALKGLRVYIDIEDLENEIMITIKNISAYELNVSADELMERFKRGDESRSSQGSGLGLSIAKSLMDLQKGRFHIEIDGDLFKAVIRMTKNIKSSE